MVNLKYGEEVTVDTDKHDAESNCKKKVCPACPTITAKTGLSAGNYNTN